jgi:ferredoxin
MLRYLFNTIVRGSRGGTFKPSMDGMLQITDAHLGNVKHLIPPAPEARPRTPFDDDTVPPGEMVMLNLPPRDKLRALSKGLPLFRNMTRGAKLYGNGFQPQQDNASPDLIAEFEALARQLGAVDIGYIEVPRYAIFKEKGIPAPYAIVFTVEMQQEPIETAPSFDCQLEVMDGYMRMADISLQLSHWLRDRGYAAYPGTALGGITDYPHLAELAGLGAIGYHGLLITPGEGARVRINTIYTNISNLPTLAATERENEHLWVRDFCAMCRKCIRQCPVDAIFDTPQPRGDSGMQTIDHAACRGYFHRNNGCGVCLAVCPFSHSGYDKVDARFKGNPDAPQFRIPLPTVTALAEATPA